MLKKIALFCLFISTAFGVEQVYLHTPDISRESLIGTVAGIRPFRKSGVRIEAEKIKDKLIIHNYGYGGAGITLSFGGAVEVQSILESQPRPYETVAILGAGVIALTTAYDLLEKGYRVHIYSNAWSPHLTSNVAAGIWSSLQFPKDLSEEKQQLHLHLLKNSKKRFEKSLGYSPEFKGVHMIPCYCFKHIKTEKAGRLNRGEEVLVHFDNGVTKQGKRVYEIGIDGKVFMEDLFLKVKQKGAILKERDFASLEDVLYLEEEVIINCTSRGSIELFNDSEFIPVRGQLVYFKPQKEVDYLYFHSVSEAPDDPNYFFVSIYPWSDRIILGGVYEFGETEPIVVPEVIEKLIRNAEHSLSLELK